MCPGALWLHVPKLMGGCPLWWLRGSSAWKSTCNLILLVSAELFSDACWCEVVLVILTSMNENSVLSFEAEMHSWCVASDKGQSYIKRAKVTGVTESGTGSRPKVTMITCLTEFYIDYWYRDWPKYSKPCGQDHYGCWRVNWKLLIPPYFWHWHTGIRTLFCFVQSDTLLSNLDHRKGGCAHI